LLSSLRTGLHPSVCFLFFVLFLSSSHRETRGEGDDGWAAMELPASSSSDGDGGKGDGD
jgi:hypothetical protein